MGRHGNRGKLTWPRQLEPLVAKHGAEKVYAAGIEALGYPPTWADSLREATVVSAKLNSKPTG